MIWGSRMAARLWLGLGSVEEAGIDLGMEEGEGGFAW